MTEKVKSDNEGYVVYEFCRVTMAVAGCNTRASLSSQQAFRRYRWGFCLRKPNHSKIIQVEQEVVSDLVMVGR